MTRSTRQQNRRAFTLIEVLAALLLVGVVLPVALRGVTLSLQSSANARHRTEAAELAQGKLNEMLLLKDVTQFGGSGDFGADWPEYRWESTSAAADAGCYEVRVTVIWTERQKDTSLQLATLIYPASGTGTTTGSSTGSSAGGVQP